MQKKSHWTVHDHIYIPVSMFGLADNEAAESKKEVRMFLLSTPHSLVLGGM